MQWQIVAYILLYIISYPLSTTKKFVPFYRVHVTFIQAS